MSQSSSRLERLSLLLLVAPLLLVVPGLGGFPYPDPSAPFSDFALTHYPYALAMQRGLAHGQYPFWFNTILSGAPLLENPLSGAWYPPGWPALLLPLPFGLNLMLLLHLLWAGWGMYQWLRSEGLQHWPALWGALAFESLPKLAAHFGAGHLTLLYAVSWTPWLLLAARRRRLQSVVLALIFLADPRWAPYAGLLWLAYQFYVERQYVASLPPSTSASSLKPPYLASLPRWFVQILPHTAIALGLAAPLWLPMLQFARLSTRSAMTAGDSLTYSLPWARLLGLFYPDLGGFHEYMLYAGQAVLLLALLALLGGGVARRIRWFWGLVVLVSLLAALGENLPLLSWVWRLPGLSWLRVPSRALFIFGLALAVLSAHGLQSLLDRSPWPRRLRLSIALLAGLSVALAAMVLFVTPADADRPAKVAPFAWALAFLPLALAWLAARFWPRLPTRVWLAGLLLLGLADGLGVDRTLFTMRPASLVLSQAGELAAYLAAQPGPFRVYSPSYSLPQQTAAFYGLELADGVDPLQFAPYAAFMRTASGVPSTGYSVTLPPFANGDPASDNAAYTPDPARLGLLNVRYVAAEFDLRHPDLVLEKRFGSTRLYRNLKERPRAWLEPAEPALAQPVDVIASAPGRLQVHAGPGRLVMSELAIPGWQVLVNDAPVEWQTATEAPLLSLDLPVGGLVEARRFFSSGWLVILLFVPALLGLFPLQNWLERRLLG